MNWIFISCIERAAEKVYSDNEKQIQENFRLQSQLGILDENIKSLSAELSREVDSRTSVQLTLASKEKDADKLQSQIQEKQDFYCQTLRSLCQNYLQDRKLISDN